MRNRKLFWCGALRMEKILFVICSALALAHAQNATIPGEMIACSIISSYRVSDYAGPGALARIQPDTNLM